VKPVTVKDLDAVILGVRQEWAKKLPERPPEHDNGRPRHLGAAVVRQYEERLAKEAAIKEDENYFQWAWEQHCKFFDLSPHTGKPIISDY